MGNGQSDSHGVKKRRPSVHSAALYVPTNLNKKDASSSNSGSTTPQHFPNSSQDLDTSAELLKKELPDELKVYCNSIERMYRFWCNDIETMSPDRYKEAAVLLYLNLFSRLPTSHKMFHKNIELQAKQFFGMFRWLITNLRQPNAERLLKSIKMLGSMHVKMGIKEEWYLEFLEAFHETITEMTGARYTPRTRFCMEQLYTLVMNIMLQRDFDSLSGPKIGSLLCAFDTFERCLEDAEARTYLEMFMRQQFCVELILFYKAYREFKGVVSQAKRQVLGRQILAEFLDNSAEKEINVSFGNRNNIYQTLQRTSDVFTQDIFDACAKEVVDLMKQNVWIGFKRSIMTLTVDADKLQASASVHNLLNRTLSLTPKLSNNPSNRSVSTHQKNHRQPI